MDRSIRNSRCDLQLGDGCDHRDDPLVHPSPTTPIRRQWRSSASRDRSKTGGGEQKKEDFQAILFRTHSAGTSLTASGSCSCVRQLSMSMTLTPLISFFVSDNYSQTNPKRQLQNFRGGIVRFLRGYFQ